MFCTAYCSIIWATFLCQSSVTASSTEERLPFVVMPCYETCRCGRPFHNLKSIPVFSVVLLVFFWHAWPSIRVKSWRYQILGFSKLKTLLLQITCWVGFLQSHSNFLYIYWQFWLRNSASAAFIILGCSFRLSVAVSECFNTYIFKCVLGNARCLCSNIWSEQEFPLILHTL